MTDPFRMPEKFRQFYNNPRRNAKVHWRYILPALNDRCREFCWTGAAAAHLSRETGHLLRPAMIKWQLKTVTTVVVE